MRVSVCVCGVLGCLSDCICVFVFLCVRVCMIVFVCECVCLCV